MAHTGMLAPGGEECDNNGMMEMRGFGKQQSFASRKEVCVATTWWVAKFEASEW